MNFKSSCAWGIKIALIFIILYGIFFGVFALFEFSYPLAILIYPGVYVNQFVPAIPGIDCLNEFESSFLCDNEGILSDFVINIALYFILGLVISLFVAKKDTGLNNI